MRLSSGSRGLFVLLLIALFRLSWAREHKNYALDVSRQAQTGGQFEGVLLELPSEKWTLASPEWVRGRQVTPFFGEVRLEKVPRGFTSGDRVTATGRFRVPQTFQNFSRAEDGLYAWQPTILNGASVSVVRLANSGSTLATALGARFRERLNSLFLPAPGLKGFVRAVWSGDARGLPLEVRELFLEGGILQVLALSGQHVAGLVVLLLFVERTLWACARVFGKSETLGLYRGRLRRALPLLACSLLYVTSEASPSIQRTFAMTIAVLLLRSRKLSTGPVQLLGTSVAILVLLNPELTASVGFFLSVAATVLSMGVQSTGTPNRFLAFLYSSTAIPILLLPTSAFFFSKIALAAPIYTLLVAWAWDLILIPVGFALVPTIVLVPETVRPCVLASLERGWEALLAGHLALRDWVGTSYITVVRPSWGELLCLEALLFILLVRGRVRLLGE